MLESWSIFELMILQNEGETLSGVLNHSRNLLGNYHRLIRFNGHSKILVEIK
jgi:hypothetical protein